VKEDFKFCVIEYQRKNKLNKKKDIQTYKAKLHKAFANICKRKSMKKPKKVSPSPG
jgi:hypothetical protein